MKFRGYVVLANVLIVRWKRVARETEWADPQAGASIDLATRALADESELVKHIVPTGV